MEIIASLPGLDWLGGGTAMEMFYFLVLYIMVIMGFFIVPYNLTDKFRKNKVSKYIPPMLSVLSIFILYIKLTFFTVGYDAIIYMVFIILFAISAFFLMLIALWLQYKEWVDGEMKNN